jgi:acyl-CoA thioester hydrolase
VGLSIGAMKDMAAPLSLYTDRVRPEWIDENDHMNVAYYMQTFDKATDVFVEHLGIGADYMASTGCSAFTVEAHICYLHELLEGDPLRISVQLLAHDAKRVHYILYMHQAEDGYLAATGEFMMLSVDLNARRATPYPDDALDRLGELMKAHADLPVPEQVGRVMSMRHA